jgi:hypothetical protein
MTPNAKRYLQLDDQYFKNDEKATKFESGYYYDPMKGYAWREKAEASYKKQQALILSEQDMQDIEDEYGCGEMFDRHEN